MPETERPTRNRELYLYFGLLALLVNVTSPHWILDIPTSFMLENLLHASASQVSWFRCSLEFHFTLGLLLAWSETYGIRLAGVTPATFGSLCRC